jgi:hypothetical protein
LLAFIGRQVGRLLQMAFGWATILLFGRVPQSKQLLLAGVALGSILWVVALIGIALPDVGTFMIALVPVPSWIDENWVRLALLAVALLLPILIGLAGLFLMDPRERPAAVGGRVVQVLRGYPYAAVLAVVLLTLIVVAPLRKLRTIIRRWEDAHIPIVVRPNGYDRVATDLEAALDSAGLPTARTKAPVILELPSKLLAAVGGAAVRRLVPDRLIVLKSKGLEVTIHPSDVAVAGGKAQVARSRAAIASRLATSAAYLTTSKEAQQVEDRLRALRRPGSATLRDAFAELDERLSSLIVPYEEWEILYRERLQTERDLLRDSTARAPQGDGFLGALARFLREVVCGWRLR